jgi:hypothetical protein
LNKGATFSLVIPVDMLNSPVRDTHSSKTLNSPYSPRDDGD